MKPANTKVVGGFVLGALALLVAAVVLFGGGALFQRTTKGVVYFQGSVSGLSVGAPVEFRGVTVGTVSDVKMEVNAQTAAAIIPVYLDFTPAQITWISGERLSSEARQDAIQRGLRAQLASQSLITGQLMVALDFFPGTPATLVGHDKTVFEIPTVPSQLEQVTKAISSLPLRDIADRALQTLTSLDTLLSSPDVHRSMTALAASLDEIEGLLTAARPQLSDTLVRADATLDAVQATATHATGTIDALTPDLKDSVQHLTQLLGNADRQVGPLTADMRTLAKSLDELVAQAQASLFTGVGVLAPRSPLRQDTEATMRNLAAASSSLRSLAAELERNPNAVIVGRAH
jgi:paraquat-inducible protein B